MLHKMRPKENRRRASVPKEKICLHIYCPFCSDQCMPRGAVCTQLLGRNVNVYAHSAHASHACQNVALALSEPTEHDLTSASTWLRLATARCTTCLWRASNPPRADCTCASIL